jgi:phosphatidate cytidylyltransferase
VLRWRFASAAVILVTVIGACWLDYACNFGRPGVWLAPVCLLLTIMATAEVLDLLSSKNLRPVAWIVYACTSLIVLAGCLPLFWPGYPVDCPIGRTGWPLLAMALATAMAFVGEMQRFEKPGNGIIHVATSIFAIAYVGLLMSFLALLRFHGDGADNGGIGLTALISMCVVVKFSDVGAYAFGRLFGRHKLVPRLSPGKTIEGAVGGLVTACVAALIVAWWIESKEAWWAWILYGILLSLAGMIGDLAESLLKRDMERKDSSTWLPGLGGILDFMDSLLTAAPVAYLFWVSGLVG